MPGQSVGEDSPATANGVFNNNSTYTGCAFDRRGDLLATDIGTAQGSFPPPDDGRLVEWFAPSYRSYCIVEGPTAGGVGPHHVDGTGGLGQPGMLALADNGDLLMPEAGPDQVVRVDHTSFPTDAAACPGGHVSAQPICARRCSSRGARPSCRSRPGSPATRRVTASPSAASSATRPSPGSPPRAQPEPGRTRVPGETIAQLGQDPNGYNPFGLAFAPDGTLYFVDIHITCKGNMIGRRMRAGRQRRAGHEGDVHRGQAGDADGRPRRLRLPHQRHRVRARPAGVPVPDGDDRPAGVGALGERRPGQGARLRQAGHRRHALKVRDATARRAPQTPRSSPVTRAALTAAALVAGLSALAACGAGAASQATTVHHVVPGRWDWPTYGHDAQHTFDGRTTLTEAQAPTLKVAWFFGTGDAVTATPTVVGGTVYVGSWDDTFYALNLETGRVRWKYRLTPQNAVTPYPGQHPRPSRPTVGS